MGRLRESWDKLDDPTRALIESINCCKGLEGCVRVLWRSYCGKVYVLFTLGFLNIILEALTIVYVWFTFLKQDPVPNEC